MVLRVEEGTSDESEGFADESVAAETEDQNSYQAREDSSEAGKPNGHSLRWENGTTQYYFQEISGIPVMPHEETVAHSLRIRPVAKRYIKIEKELENLRTDLRIKDWTEKDRAGAEKREKELVKEVGRLQTPRFIDAVNAMVEGNLRLVIHMAKRFIRIMPLAEAVQYGNLGLRKAAIRWDSKKGHKFITYASWWIFESITSGIAEIMGPLRTPKNGAYLAVGIYEAMGRLEQRGIKEPTTETITDEINAHAKTRKFKKRLCSSDLREKPPEEISVAKVRLAQRADIARTHISLDYEPERGRPFMDSVSFQEASRGSGVEEKMLEPLIEDDRTRISEDALACLSGVDRQVIELRIMEDEPPSTYEVGDMFGKSHQWPTNRTKVALSAMREYLETQGYTADDLM